MKTLDYQSIGLRVGLEVHRQLNTGVKLFCQCPTTLSSGDTGHSFTRMLRPTQSELGQLDEAAAFEFHKRKTMVYSYDDSNSCLVEMDEEPPHTLNPEAIDIAVTVAIMLNASILDEIHIIRKIVIDGSNTTGFQRTCIVALDGELRVSEETIPIQQVSLEEDAARKISETYTEARYHIDRLGIPLIEVTTAPVMTSPGQAEEVARRIGRVLRATGRVRRGLGSVRQDLNISTSKGALVEVKGVQRLDLVSKIVQSEAQRQTSLLQVREELAKRKVDAASLHTDPVPLTQVLKGTSCKVIRSALDKGGEVWGIRLKGFGGLLKKELAPGIRLGTELADRAKVWGGVGGIFHSDELPAYGITEAEKEAALKTADARVNDALVIVADKVERCLAALRAVTDRCMGCLGGVPAETRAPSPDGTTRYMRPRPGAERMYPETDVPSFPVTHDQVSRIKASLPPFPEQIAAQIRGKHDLSDQLVEELMDSDQLGLFEKLSAGTRLPPSFIAASLTEAMKSLERDGIDTTQLSDEKLEEAFRLVSEGFTAKESLLEIFRWMAQNPDKNAQAAIENLDLRMLPPAQLERIVAETVLSGGEVTTENLARVRDKMIGYVMAKVRGRADPTLVFRLVEQELQKCMKSPTHAG